MSIEKPNIIKTTPQMRLNIKNISAFALPNNPSARGMTPEEIKKAFWAPLLEGNASLLNEIDRIVDSVNAYLNTLFAHIGTGEVPELDASYEEWKKNGESGITAVVNVLWRMVGDYEKRLLDSVKAARSSASSAQSFAQSSANSANAASSSAKDAAAQVAIAKEYADIAAQEVSDKIPYVMNNVLHLPKATVEGSKIIL